MSIFAISDLHLSLADEQKSMEIFNGWKNYVEKLKENWLKKISKNDTIVIAGDISWAMTLEETKKDFEFINNLPGKKIFVKGNHDYWWSTAKKINDFLKMNNFDSISILYNSFFEVENVAICGSRGWPFKVENEQDEKIFKRELGRIARSIDLALEKNLEPIVFLHYPPIYGNEISEDIINILIEKKVKKCYYGHVHGVGAEKKLMKSKYNGINFELISCDYINFCPTLVKL